MSVPLLPMTTRLVSMPLVKVTILHDYEPFGDKSKFDPTALPKLEQVFECQAYEWADVRDVLDSVFEEFNIGETSTVAREYRALRLRSLSVGDVVVVGKSAYRCDKFGWTEFALYKGEES